MNHWFSVYAVTNGETDIYLQKSTYYAGRQLPDFLPFPALIIDFTEKKWHNRLKPLRLRNADSE